MVSNKRDTLMTHRGGLGQVLRSASLTHTPACSVLLPCSAVVLCLSALLHTLAAKGSLGQMKARIRSEIFSALDQSDDSQPRAPLSNTNLLINELIREYMMFNQYRYSLNVFLPETNQPEVPPFDRAFIAQELHVQENQHSVQMSG